MLVLTRKQSERVRIGPDITLTIVRIDDNKVRIGIEAPSHVPVQREEIIGLVAPQQAARR
ncbi:MAG TPA: carbon storage regulator [Planctomycetia bacterium]|nr:carbon storage regulator [Planctomycetia bacterium]